ncbi:MAG: GIY-YIG nuclease family protein [Candidatus Parcubacteria bacterium]|nr:GIY-YIG nuclease family protein [Candidatus Parcubacteria bacterium]
MYYVYLLKCADGSFYCGITTDLNRRLEEHNSSPLGAKYTKGRRPVVLAYAKKYENRSEASKEEAKIKKMKREEKERMINKE